MLVRHRLPKVLVLMGAITMVVGLIATVTMLVVQDRCQHDQIGYPDDPSVIAACASYQDGANWGYAVLGVGAIGIVAGALAGSRLVRPRSNTT